MLSARTAIISLALLCWMTGTAAADDAITLAPTCLMGRCVGDQIEKWAKTLNTKDEMCSKPEKYGRKYCTDASLVKSKHGNTDWYTIGDIEVIRIFYNFIDDKMYGFFMASNWGYLDEIRSMATGRWGEPSFSNATLTQWRLPDGLLELTRVKNDAHLSFTSNVGAELVDQRHAAYHKKLQADGKRLF